MELVIPDSCLANHWPSHPPAGPSFELNSFQAGEGLFTDFPADPFTDFVTDLFSRLVSRRRD